MRKHAIVNDNVVTEVSTLDEQQYQSLARQNQLILDVHDLLVQPQIGWLLQGNQLVPAPHQQLDLKTLIKARIKYYQDQAPELLRDLYAENTLLGITAAQSDQMFDDYQDVLIRIREGAWPTAVYRLSQKQPAGFVTQQMLDAWSALIQARIIP